MESRVLNFINGMEIAKLLLQYFRLELIETYQRDLLVLDFIEHMTTEEMSKVILMFVPQVTLEKEADTLATVISGLASENLYNLVVTYKKAGFAHDA